MLTAHDYPSARFIESSSSLSHITPDAASSLSADERKALHLRRGVDICLVGDSLAMVACGYTSTNQLTLDEMLYHCRSVARGCQTSLLVADLPFGTYGASVEQGVRSAFRLVQEGHMDAVKIEGGHENVPLVRRLTDLGVPVMAHIGLTPQRAAALSGFRVQGKTVASARGVYADALALQEAGAFSLLIEAVPDRLGAFISRRVKIPTIGIGAGAGADGQVLVQLDMLGVNSLARGPKFLKRYGDMERLAGEAIWGYVEEVRGRAFPAEEHTYGIADEEWDAFERAVEEQEASIDA